MTGSTKLVLGVLAGLVAGGATVGVLASAKKAAAAAPPPALPPPPSVVPALPPPAGHVLWIATSTIAPGARVRLSLAASDFATIAQSLGLTIDFAGWQNLLASAAVQSAIHASSLLAWAPVGGAMLPAPLPADWPADDVGAASEYHAELVYGGTVPLSTATLPVPVLAWVAKATGA
jgi:hypothetical protein